MTDTKFDLFGEELLNKLTEKHRAKFVACNSASQRIKFIFALSRKQKYDFVFKSFKDIKSVRILTQQGDQYVKSKRYNKALDKYNEAIKVCPQDTIENKEFYCSIIEKRCNVYFLTQDYPKTLKDLKFLKQNGDGNSCNLKQIVASDALRLYNLNCGFNSMELNNNDLNEKTSNITYPALSSKLIVKQNATMGRYVVASDSIKPGEIVAIESPFVSVVKNNNQTNCGHCAMFTNHIYACAACDVIYCSVECLQDGSVYHTKECAILSSCGDEIPNHCKLTFGMVIRKSLQDLIQDEADAYKKQDGDGSNNNVGIYNTHDYSNIVRLSKHEDTLDLECLTIQVVTLLILLKNTQYFGATNNQMVLSDDELFVGVLLVKYLQILQDNSHAVYLLDDKDILQNVGTALYPTVSLFNHACDPSVRKFNIKNQIVMRAIKPIQPGDIMNDCYGQYYYEASRLERRFKMAGNYRFVCECQACLKDWPLSENMDPRTFDVLCVCGNEIPANMGLPVVKCLECSNLISVLKVTKVIFETIEKFKKAEQLLFDRQCDEARLWFEEIIDVHFKYISPAFYYTIKSQERLEECFLFDAKKTFCN